MHFSIQRLSHAWRVSRFATTAGSRTGACLAAVMSTSASAHVFDLTTDFSYAANPNGQWAYKRGADLLAYTPTPLPPSASRCSTDGYWGSAWEAIVFRPTIDSTQTPGYGADDWVAGDVITYTPDSGATVRITWTAPCDGTITYAGSAWYASTIVSRSNVFTLALNGGAALATGVVNPTVTRSNAITFSSRSPIAVVKGDRLDLTFVKNVGESWGSFSGSTLSVQFETPTECMADLNGDCSVSGEDLVQVLAAWGRCSDCAPDFNHDGVVDGNDLAVVLGQWGSCQ